MLILTWVGIIFVTIARCKIMTNIMPTHVKISIEPGIRELFLKLRTHHNIILIIIQSQLESLFSCKTFHCKLEVSTLPLSTIFLLDFETVQTVRYFFFHSLMGCNYFFVTKYVLGFRDH
jgi:hypothetical protein